MSDEEIKLDDRLSVRISKKTKEEFSKKAKATGSNASELVLKWVKEYLSQEQQNFDVTTVATKLEHLEQRVASLEGKSAA
jgi:Ribbon-helix-helix protein, copG family